MVKCPKANATTDASPFARITQKDSALSCRTTATFANGEEFALISGALNTIGGVFKAVRVVSRRCSSCARVLLERPTLKKEGFSYI